jgi:CRISPR-associated endonuclease/helicase Cas3
MGARQSFEEFFEKATKNPPYDYQVRLALADEPPELVHIPTGLGKTAAVVIAWVWRRSPQSGFRESTPRRLVYCLPMRVLVEQTESAVRTWLHNLHPDETVTVHVLMGGEDASDWDLYPERDAILIGTQDMLLSRALNRGYAMSRYRWPMQFGLLNNDCLWVFDEVQLMGSALATTAQLDAFRKKLWSPLRVCPSLWMSATLGDQILETRDRQDWSMTTPLALGPTDKDLQNPAVTAAKGLMIVGAAPKPTKRDGSGILDMHDEGRVSLVVLNTVADACSHYSDLLEATERHQQSRKSSMQQPELCLLHSRFRPVDRRQTMCRLLDFLAKRDRATRTVADHPGIVLVATQVVEAGLDWSASRLWSEIAPWASIVQRLGRLNREGAQPDARAVFWMPKADQKRENAKEAPNTQRVGPYDKDDLDQGRRLLKRVEAEVESGNEYRAALDAVSSSEEGRKALRFEPDVVVRPDDVFGLFCTEPDLAGGFTNVSHFVRDQDRNVDVHVFWRDIPRDTEPADDEPAPRRDELCPVPYYELRQFLEKKGSAWDWNYESGRWERRFTRDVYPGMTLMLASVQGGYSDQLGWTGNADDKPTLYDQQQPGTTEQRFEVTTLDSLHADSTSETGWAALSDHLADVAAEIEQIARDSQLDTPLVDALRLAANWHDWGKSLERWQGAVARCVQKLDEKIDQTLRSEQYRDYHEVASALRERLRKPSGQTALWAKFPNVEWLCLDPHRTDAERKLLKKLFKTQFRPGLRHEAASALAAWQAWQDRQHGLTALAVYLIASHHGKVRTVLRSTGRADQVFGLVNTDTLCPVAGHFGREASLDFEPKLVGSPGTWDANEATVTVAAPSWTAVVTELLGTGHLEQPVREAIPEGEPHSLGPFALAYLESLLRVADSRASNSPGKGQRR